MKRSTYLIIAGAISLMAGLLALANPVIAGLTVTLLTAWAFIISGVLTLASLFTAHPAGSKGWTIFWGALTLLAGISLLLNPLAGLVTLTTLLGLLFILTGLSRVMLSQRLPTGQLYWILVVSGVLSILVGAMLVWNAVGAAPFAIGTLVALELLLSGVAMVSYGMTHRAN